VSEPRVARISRVRNSSSPSAWIRKGPVTTQYGMGPYAAVRLDQLPKLMAHGRPTYSGTRPNMSTKPNGKPNNRVSDRLTLSHLVPAVASGTPPEQPQCDDSRRGETICNSVDRSRNA
jgi:hypothetical protein